MKQNEWQEIEAKKKHGSIKEKSKSVPLETTNSFAVLAVDDVPEEPQSSEVDQPDPENNLPVVNGLETKNFSTQLYEYRSNKNNKFYSERNEETLPVIENMANQESKTQDPEVLVVGDSMIKNIDASKLTNATGSEAVCKTYRGAKIEEVRQEFKNDCNRRNKKAHSIILHVGTNNLVDEKASEAAEKMEKLILEAKTQGMNVAVSSVVRRYDNKVNPARIVEFNNLLHELCKKHKIAFISNNNIGQNELNRSKLHLNRKGDKMLGGAFCYYLRSLRVDKPNTSKRNKQPVNFRQTMNQYRNRPKDWVHHLDRVYHLTRM